MAATFHHPHSSSAVTSSKKPSLTTSPSTEREQNPELSFTALGFLQANLILQIIPKHTEEVTNCDLDFSVFLLCF